MKKRFFLVLAFMLLIFLFENGFVSAVAGVIPAFHEINFEPGEVHNLAFNFINEDGLTLEVYAEGPFSEYVSLDKESLVGGGSVKLKLSLPESYDTPGRHRLLIGARPVQESNGIGIVANVQGVIFIDVPYPGKYAEVELSTANANLGEEVPIRVKISSKGEESITASTLVEIRTSDGKFVEEIDLGTTEIEPDGFIELVYKLLTKEYSAGDYIAKALVNYGETVEKESLFRLGRLFVDVSNYSTTFKKNKINRFEIEAESYWNNVIDGVYANVSIKGYPELDFLTPSLSIEPWSKKTLVGFFDSSEINGDTLEAKIVINYEGEATEKIVYLDAEDEFDYLNYVAIVAIVAVVILYFIFRKKHEKKKK